MARRPEVKTDVPLRMKTIDPKPVLALLQRLLEGMVAYPDDLRIEHRALTASVTITIQAHAADTPRLIGEGAANYRALVAVLMGAGAQQGYRVNIPPIREPITGEPERYSFQADPNWPRSNILALVRETAKAVVAHPSSVRIAVDDDDPNITTTVEVFVSRTERAELVDALAPAIRRLFDAIGRAKGRLVAVDFMAESDPAQPDTADGRNTKSVNR